MAVTSMYLPLGWDFSRSRTPNWILREEGEKKYCQKNLIWTNLAQLEPYGRISSFFSPIFLFRKAQK